MIAMNGAFCTEWVGHGALFKRILFKAVLNRPRDLHWDNVVILECEKVWIVLVYWDYTKVLDNEVENSITGVLLSFCKTDSPGSK